MKSLVFLGCSQSGSSKDAVEAAKRLGFTTVLLTDRRSFLHRRDDFPHVDRMVLVDLKDPRRVEDQVRNLMETGLDVSAIVSFTDAHVGEAARLSRKLGMPYQTVEAIERMQDKITLRECLREAPYSVPFQIVQAHHDVPSLELDLPIVVKSPRSTGSKDVLFAGSRYEFERHVARLRARYPDGDVLVEAYVPGTQYLVEAVVHRGQVHVAAIVEQVVTFGQRFIVTGYSLRPSIPEKLAAAVEDMMADICQRTGMETGAFHTEFRWSGGGCRVIEVNPRISGAAMNRLIEYAHGFNLAEQTLRSLFGDTPDVSSRNSKCIYACYLTVNKPGYLEKVTGRRRARQVSGVREVFVKPRKNAYLTPPLSMGKRYAYVIAEAETERDARAAAEKAGSYIRFHLRNGKTRRKETVARRRKS
ncbi:ATP-grasp domain-containing protein [Alicyclobacillus kakegawensis]|uniref:ATP-grasp domain-containing protein n=1 Tax=Alicyclobacillus kakegawensis TaxID=392012 RepID=UPI0008333815|nr:ATP-grasp domain-containing protein [Alicyclobacillus kakegawensis]